MIIYAVVHDLLADIAVEEIARFEQELYEFVDAVHPEIMQQIQQTGNLSAENEAAMVSAIKECKEKFLASR